MSFVEEIMCPFPPLQNILVTFGLRNSFIHLRPFASTRFFWVSQFANFFTVPDYEGVPGYVLPKVEVCIDGLGDVLMVLQLSILFDFLAGEWANGIFLKKVLKKTQFKNEKTTNFLMLGKYACPFAKCFCGL